MVSILRALADLEDQNQSGVLCTIIRSLGSTPRHVGSKMLVYPDGHIMGSIGGGEMERRVIDEALAATRDSKARLLEYSMSDPQRGDPGVCGGKVEIFVEPLRPKPTLLVVGMGHVGKAVAYLGRWLGFRVAVSDDRPEFCTPETVPEADVHLAIPMADLPNQLKITPWTYIVLTTRSVDLDVPGLPALLATPAAYIGIIGSKRRWATTKAQLTANGVSEEALNRVRSPMGLEISAETPQEIAVSILAEIIQLRGNVQSDMVQQKQVIE